MGANVSLASAEVKEMSGATETPIPSQSPAPSATPSPTAEPVTIESIEVVDSLVNIPYLYVLKKEDIKLLVVYSDNTSDLVHPDSISDLNSSIIGETSITVTFGDKTITYNVTVVPRQVTKVAMKEGTKTTMTIGWNKQEEAELYEIYTSTVQEGNYKLKTTTTNSTFTFENMTPGTIIYVKIRAVAGNFAGDESVAIAIAPRPEKVTYLSATKANKTSVELEWSRAVGATSYAIYYCAVGSDNYVLGGTTTFLNCTVTGLSTGKNYYFKVYAYAADISNLGEGSPEYLFGTAPGTPTISKIKGGDRRIKVYWKKTTGATSYRIYISTKADSGYRLFVTASADEYRLRNIVVQLQNKKYYVRIEAVRVVNGMELTTTCGEKSAKTVKAKVTSTKAKYYKTKKAFKKSNAYKKFKDFRKKVSYSKSIIMPGLTSTNVAGFNAGKIVPQGITVAGKYMLVSAYDKSKNTESVIFVLNKNTKKLCTTVVMPYSSHLGGIAYDGTNLWVTYGKYLHSIPFAPIKAAADNKQQFYEVYKINSVCKMPETVSYVSYYKGMVWAGAYNEKVKKYMYGYQIDNKGTQPTLTLKHRMLMPNRTQGVAFTSGGKMLVSRSCQTSKGKSGFMSSIDVYQPTWNMSQYSIKKNKRKKCVKVPSMNEGIVISGSYTYVIYESSAFSECISPMDRITAFKTSKLC